jgi:hypothetical protein
MNAARDRDEIRLALNTLEARVLRHILDAIITNYQTPPDQMDAKGAAAWYSSRGCETAQLSAEETRDWLEQIHGFRSANVALLQMWSDQLARRSEGRFELRLELAQAPSLVTALNDHRLLVAARNDIGQAEMDLAARPAVKSLAPAQRTALFEIHLLAWMIEELLRLIAPEAADWMH